MTPVNKQAVAAAFGRAAQSYSQHDELQRQSAGGFCRAWRQPLSAVCWTRAVVPAATAATGAGRGSQVTAIDLSDQMLDEARQRQAADHYLLADIEAIPLADAQFDWSGVIWRSSGAAACRRPCASFIAWRDRAGRWPLPPCWKARCRS